MLGRVKFKDSLRTFKAMYQQIQGLRTEEKALEISKMWRSIIQKGRNFNEFQTALSDMNMQNQFNKMSVLNVKQFQKTSMN
jgi:orotate phosphoribosyltransferase-like protein